MAALAQAPYRARVAFSHTFDSPVKGPIFDIPQHLGVLLEHRFEGISALTGLARYGGEELGQVRRARLLAGGLLVEARHLFLLDPATGKARFEYPLNCNPGGGCQAQVLDADEGTVLLAGFGAVPNLVMPLGLPGGKELWGTGAWLETGPLAAGALRPGGALLLLRDERARVLLVDFGTRQTVKSVASPVQAMPLRWWVGAEGAAFEGLGDEGKVLVFLHADGRSAWSRQEEVEPLHAWPAGGHWFGTARQGRSLRFFTEDGRLLASRDCKEAPRLWFLDGRISLETLEVQRPDGVLILEQTALGHSLVMLNPAGGKELWRRDFPSKVEVAGLGESELVLRSGGRVLVLGLGNGALRGILELPGVSGELLAPQTLNDGRLAVGAGALLMVLERQEASNLAEEFARGLVTQDPDQALLSFRAWEPFEQGVEEVGRMRASLVDGLVGRALAPAGQGPGLGATLAGLAYLCRPGSACGQRVAGVLTLLYFADLWYPSDEAETAYFVDVLSSVSVDQQLGAAATLYLDPRLGEDATLRFEALLPGEHPAVARKDRARLDQLVESVTVALEAGELPVAVKLLKELSRTKALEELLGLGSEALLDAKSVDLLPPELLPQRVPEIQQALAAEYRTALGRDLGWQKELCLEGCRAAAAACDGEPTLGPRACQRPGAACRLKCQTRDPRARWDL